MPTPLYSARELRHIARILGALLTLVAGLVLLAQAALIAPVPPPRGHTEATATVITRSREGTFQNPSFLLTLAYDVYHPDGTMETFRSGRHVPFETYHALHEGDTVTVYYAQDDPFDWQLVQDEAPINRYGLALLMIVFGLFSLTFPPLLNWASRQQDFDYSDELPPDHSQAEESVGSYDQSKQIPQR